MTQCGLWIDGPAEGAWNMAVDEYRLTNADDLGPTLRFYFWSRPTLSLGYFQKYNDRNSHLASRTCDCVRRHSGGGAIMHDQELTYSLVMPTNDRWSRRTEQLYTMVHNALIRAYARFGATCELSQIASKEPFLCFQRRAIGDILMDGHKVTGSAQRRHRGAILQHGSILVAQSEFAPELPGLSNLSQSEWDCEQLMDACEQEIGLELKLRFSRFSTEKFESNVKTIRNSKFSSEEWTKRR